MHNWVKGRPNSTLAGSRSVFSHAHVLGKYEISIYFPICGWENSAEGFYFAKKYVYIKVL